MRLPFMLSTIFFPSIVTVSLAVDSTWPLDCDLLQNSEVTLPIERATILFPTSTLPENTLPKFARIRLSRHGQRQYPNLDDASLDSFEPADCSASKHSPGIGTARCRRCDDLVGRYNATTSFPAAYAPNGDAFDTIRSSTFQQRSPARSTAFA